MQYFLFLEKPTQNRITIELVDEYVYKHWANALLNDETRYDGRGFVVNSDGTVTIRGTFNKVELGIIMHIADIKRAEGALSLFDKPEMIRLLAKSGSSNLLHEMNGDTFTVMRNKKANPEESAVKKVG